MQVKVEFLKDDNELGQKKIRFPGKIYQNQNKFYQLLSCIGLRNTLFHISLDWNFKHPKLAIFEKLGTLTKPQLYCPSIGSIGSDAF